MTAASPVAIVGVRFLNSRPLLAGLEAGITAPFRYTFSTAEPSACAEELASGKVVAGLVPVAALPAMHAMRAMPTLGVACRQEVTSVLLVSRVELSAVRTLAAHTASRTSVALARLLLAERWGATPRIIPARPPLAAMLAEADAAVLIGDDALKVHGHTGAHEVDLAAAWVEWTALPFVFAVWGVAAAAPEGLDMVLEESLRFAERNWDSLLPPWAAAHGVPVAETRHYLAHTLYYRLTDLERAGMTEFLRRAAACGVLPAAREVWRAA